MSESHNYTLSIDGPLFRKQRQALLDLRSIKLVNETYQALDGIIDLLDEIADQAHDSYGINCLLHGEPDAKTRAAVEDLAAKADTANLQPEDLDSTVHDLAASIAADVNNGGLDDQIRYLIQQLGIEHAERQIDALIENHANQTEEDP